MDDFVNVDTELIELNDADILFNLLTFHLDEQHYALPVGPIAQIVPMVTITPIPQASSVAEGVINVRGEAVPVVDLRRHLVGKKSQILLYTPIILTGIKGCLIGLIVDDVSGVINLPSSRLIQPGDILPEELHNSLILKGLIHAADGTILLLDPDQLFDSDQLQICKLASEFIAKLTKTGTLEKQPPQDKTEAVQ